MDTLYAFELLAVPCVVGAVVFLFAKWESRSFEKRYGKASPPSTGPEKIQR